jgi:trehalose/maltose hydrolase-like predicted phosphorylase
MGELWRIVENNFDPIHLRHLETMFIQGNGSFSSHGEFEEYCPGKQRTTFVHGILDDVAIAFTELVNFSDWLKLQILLTGERFSLSQGEMLACERLLDLRTRLQFRRFTGLAMPIRPMVSTLPAMLNRSSPHTMILTPEASKIPVLQRSMGFSI